MQNSARMRKKVQPPLREKKTEGVHYAIMCMWFRLGHLLGAIVVPPDVIEDIAIFGVDPIIS